MAELSTTQNKLPPSGIAESIKFMRDTGISLYVHGAPGISKSAVSRQVADELGISFIDFRLTSVAPEDIRGVPFVDDAGGMKGLIWTPPLVFPRDLDLAEVVYVDGAKSIKFYNPIGNNGIHYCKNPNITVAAIDEDKIAHVVESTPDRFIVVIKDDNDNLSEGKVSWNVTGKSEAILGLEEFNSASPAVMAAAYQMILDRRIGDYVVPKGVMIVAMGNRDGDKGVTYKIPKPVSNRFDHLEMEINHEDWQNWAIRNNIHSDVIGYLAKWTSHLFDENFASNPEQSFATPRTWEFVSKIISNPNKPSKRVLKALICGAIGNVIGTTFLLHREFMEDMPQIKEILNGNIKTFTVRDNKYKLQIAYSIAVQMCYELKKELSAINHNGKNETISERQEWNIKADNAIEYSMNNFTPEVIMVFQRMALAVYSLPFNSKGMKNFTKFAKEYRDLVF